MPKPSIYLDHNATTTIRPDVVDVMVDIIKMPCNSSSAHSFGRKAKQILESSRRKIADSVSCFPAEIIFTGSGSESNNMALRGISGRKVIISSIEHASVIGASGDETQTIPVDKHGIVNLSALDEMLAMENSPVLLSVMLANNETGVIQPISELVEIARKYNALVHCDAVQAFGKIPVDMGLLGVDMLSLSAHKIGGSQGVGALVVRQGIDISPLIIGGGQESRRRAGTENLAGIAGFAKAAELSQADDWIRRIAPFTQEMEAVIKQNCPNAFVLGEGTNRLPNTSSILMPNISAETQLMHFDLAGIAVSTGSACSSGRISHSHVASAMGISSNQGGIIRVSSGWNSKYEDLMTFASEWVGFYNKIS